MSQTGYLSGATLGRFKIGGLLGRGGMGEVYRAEDTELGRHVAVKVLPEALLADPDRVARFVQEARTASALNHPHIVAIYDIGRQAPDGAARSERVQYVAMELVAGSTLREVIDGRKAALTRMLDYLGQAAEALAAAHAAGIVHRDLKPENLMIADGGYVKVLDFGLAKLRGEAAAQAAASTMTAGTSPGLVMGTVGYMSPEQAMGRTVDHRSDIFSFGCILYEAATGARAFSGDSTVDTLHRIIHGQPEPIAARVPSAPSELQRIVRKCLAKDPEDRYQSMKEVAIDLRDLRKQFDSAPVVAPGRTVAARRSSAAVIVGVALVVALAAAVWAWRASRGGATPPAEVRFSRVTQSGNVIDAVVSADGKYVAYAESAAGKQGLWYRQINGTRAIELVPAAAVGVWGMALSRDGTSVYYALKSTTDSLGTLFEVPVLGGTPRRILSGIDSAVSFSADGSRIVYLRAAYPQLDTSAVMIANADGSEARPLATVHAPDLFAPGFFVAASWSPDGTHVSATIRNSQTREARLVVIDAASGAIAEMPGRYGEAGFTEWLPDGSGIVVIGSPLGVVPGPGGQILVQPYPSGPVRRVTNDLIDYRVAHVTADGHSMLSVGFDATTWLWLSSLDRGGEATKLSSLSGDGRYGIAWTDDARRLYFGSASSDRRVVTSMAPDGSDRRDLAVEGQSMWPCPSHDGSFVAFFGMHGGQPAIWRAAPDGSDVRLLAALSDATYLAVSPDDRWVYFNSAASGIPSTWRVSTAGGKATLIAPGLDRASISPDGTRLAGWYAPRSTATLSLAVLPQDGGAPLNLFPNFAQPSSFGSILWAPDGASLLYTSIERTNIWRQRLDAATSEPEKVTRFSDLVLFRFAVARDGQLAIVRGTQTRDAVLIRNFR